MNFPQGPDRYEFIKNFDLSQLHDSNKNGENVTRLVKTWVALLLNSPVDSTKPLKLIANELKIFRRDLSGRIRWLSSLADELNNSLVVDDFGEYCTSLHHEFRKTPVFREYCSWFEDRNPGLYQWILTYLSFGKKAEYNDPSFNSVAFRDWNKIEDDLGSLVLPEHVLDDMHEIFRSSGMQLNPEDLKFQHGPGSTAGKAGRNFLKKNLSVDISEELKYVIDLIEYHIHSPGLSTLLPIVDGLSSSPKIVKAVDWAELLFVRKNIKTARSICKENVPRMYIQQGVKNALDEAVRRSKYGFIIIPEDQSKNRKKALESTFTLEWSTIDLSWASDSVHEDLVRRVFTDEWTQILFATRSTLVKLPDGSFRRIRKFAPMGSACCFPVQSIIFATVAVLCDYLDRMGICVDAYLRNGVPVVYGQPYFDRQICIYGDDIIVRNRQTRAVMSLLTALGLKINYDKSFFGSRVFRESCGIYCMRGDVTPLLFKVKHLIEMTPGHIQSSVDMANRLTERGYIYAREMILSFLNLGHYVESDMVEHPHHVIRINPRPTYTLKPGRRRNRYIGSDGREYRLNRNLQRLEVRLSLPVSKIVGNFVIPPLPSSKKSRLGYDDPTSRYLYNKWLQSPSSIEGSKPPVGNVGKPTLRRIWTPV